MGAERNWNVNGSISKVSYDQDATDVRRSSSLRKSVRCPLKGNDVGNTGNRFGLRILLLMEVSQTYPICLAAD